MANDPHFYPVAHTDDLRFRPGKRFSAPMVNLPLYKLVGQVAVYWGALEQKMDGILSAFVAADSDADDDGWERKQFRKRQEMFKKKVASRFPGAIADEVNSILSAARAYHWQRNLIVHGHASANFVDGIGTAVVKGVLNGRFVSLQLHADHLSRMFAELGFLSGRLESLTAEDDAGSYLSSPDRSLLRAFVTTNQPPAPIPQSIAPQHPA